MSGAYLDWLEIFIREWTRDEEYEREVMHSWTNNGSKRSGEKKKTRGAKFRSRKI